jgi:formylglycine-generating enzyme required for sulfatase activity
MYFVSWDEALQYCHKLNELEKAAGRLPDGYEYALPTEAQWEYASRSGSTVNIPANLDDVAWYSANSGDETKPVAQKLPNAWALYDMQGNVMEWCSDYYGIYPGGGVSNHWFLEDHSWR